MTPTTQTRAFSFPHSFHDKPAELAIRPLQFTTQRQCTNKAVLAAVIDALADKRQSDQTIASILRNAWRDGYQAELNALIQEIETQQGKGTVVVNENVMGLLLAEEINLTQNDDGTVQLSKDVTGLPDTDRQLAVDLTLGEKNVGKEVCKLISSYDEEIVVDMKNKAEIIAILRFGDPTAKSLLLAAASHQRAIGALNYLLAEMCGENDTADLDLSHTDLSNLDLSDILLSTANLSFANLQNTCLKGARLDGATLKSANLNNTNLSQAVLNGTDLTNARLVGANMYEATIRGAILKDTCMLGVNLQGALYRQHRDETGVVLNCSNVKAINTDPYGIDCVNPDVSPTVDVVISPRLPDSSSSPTVPFSSTVPEITPGRTTVTIDESEKNILLAQGMRLKDNGDGSVQLRRAPLMYEDPARSYFWKSALEDQLPETVTDVIGTYTSEIELGAENRDDIMEIFRSDDPVAKRQVIAAAANQGQIRFLNQLLQEFRAQGIRLNLSQVDLSNLDLPGIDLSHADLTGANLQGCKLRHATLQHADLTGASLIKADLYGAKLMQTTLKHANLDYADLDSADLRGGTDLSHACLDHTNLRDTRLNGAIMINVSLNHAHLHHVNLNQADLTNANIMHSQITYTSLLGAKLGKADFSHSLLHCVGLKNTPTVKDTIWTDTTAKTIFSDQHTRDALPIQFRPECVSDIH